MKIVRFTPTTDIALSHTLIKLMHTEFVKTFATYPTFVLLGRDHYASQRHIQMAEHVLGFMNMSQACDYTIGPLDIALCDGINGHAIIYTSPNY